MFSKTAFSRAKQLTIRSSGRGKPRRLTQTLGFLWRYSRKLVLHCLTGYKPALDMMVAQFVKDEVVFIGVVGKDCSRIEDIVDEIVVGEGFNNSHFILTSSHEGKSLEEAIEFAESLTGEYAGEVQVVQI